jgi:ABC-2 type transport system permease protein
MAIAIVVLLVGTAAAGWGILSLREAPADVVLAVTVLGGSAVTLGFALAPLIAGATDPLDPRRFAVFGLPHGKLAVVLAVAGLISVPIVVLATLGVCVAIVWSEHGVPWFVAGVGVLLAVLTCALLARSCMALTSLFLRDRRSRELTGVFALAILVVVVPVGVFFASLEWRGTVPTQLAEAVSALALTPFGAALAFPAGVEAGASSAWASLAVAVATIAVLGGAWVWLVGRVLTTAERPVTVRERGGLGWFAVAPGTPAGGVAARSLIYWLRDRRYIVNVLVVPITAVLTMVPLLVVGVPLSYVALVPVPIAALFFGWLPHNDLAYDSTAIWMHVASGLRGVSDRLGRLVPIVVIAVPVLAVAIPVVVLLHGRWAVLPAMTGVCAALFLSGLGLSSISSVVAPYAVARPGDSPFQQPQRVGAGGAVAQGLVLLGAIVLSAPVLWWAWRALTVDPEEGVTALWGGLAIGGAVLIVGVAIGSLAFRRRGARLMEFAEST